MADATAVCATAVHWREKSLHANNLGNDGVKQLLEGLTAHESLTSLRCVECAPLRWATTERRRSSDHHTPLDGLDRLAARAAQAVQEQCHRRRMRCGGSVRGIEPFLGVAQVQWRWSGAGGQLGKSTRDRQDSCFVEGRGRLARRVNGVGCRGSVKRNPIGSRGVVALTTGLTGSCKLKRLSYVCSPVVPKRATCAAR